MAQKLAVHVEFRGEGWAVVREGNKRATSTHSTQSEAAERGRELARRDKSEFFLHAQDGEIREHRDYRERQPSADEGIADTVSETVGTVTGVVGGTAGVAARATGGASQKTETTADRDDSVADAASSAESSGRGVEAEVRGLTGAGEPLGTPEQRYAEYAIYDQYGERIGPLSDLFVDENDEPEYVGVETGLPTNRSVLVPAEAITVDDRLRRMVVSHPRSLVETAPSLGHEDEVTPEFERRVRVHYGLDAEERAGALYTDAAEPTEVRSTDPAPDVSGHEEDDVRVRRSEEEIRVQTREREAGEIRVRKRVRTERERLSVPKKRVEVTVERVPVEGAVPAGDEAAQIGEEEIVVPVVEEEIVVEKRPVVKEEIRIRKEVVEDVEVVEEDVRREEVEIDDQTGRDTGSHSDAK
ncbi:MAG TPA: DUF2382 domain-containing protein [Rubrobacter sp.]|nr:DUF2382 domain-containing protein [Rubrobacter sp.]